MLRSSYVLLIILSSCSLESTPIPGSSGQIILPKASTSIQAIKERVAQSDSGFIEFSHDEDTLLLHGYVTSSDEGGNFYKEIYIQDEVQSSKSGLRVFIDKTALVDLFPKGRKVGVYLNGLGSGIKNGVLSLGIYQGNDLGRIPSFRIENYFKFSDRIYTLQPELIGLEDNLDDHLGKWVSLANIQFAKSERGKTFAGEAFDEYDGERRLVQCNDQLAILMSTSTFSDYKSILLPQGSGTIAGVLTRDFFGYQYVLKPNNPSDLYFDQARCDPFFEESFEEVRLGFFEGNGWSNFNVLGSQKWEVYEDENALGQSIRIGSYRSGDKETQSWLISPKIEVSQIHKPMLAFRTSVSFADASLLTPLISHDWSGEKSTLDQATWIALPLKVAHNDDDAAQWIDSGVFSLVNYESFYLAFKYEGSGKSTHDGTFEVDDIRVYEGPTINR